MKRTATPAGSHAAHRQMLLDKKTDMLAGLSVKFDTVARLGRVAEEDQAQLTHDEFVSLHKNGLDYRQLCLIEEALDRMDAGDYGVCLNCEMPIAPKRLQAVPWARYCIRCQDSAAMDGGAVQNDTRQPVASRR